MSGSTFIHRLMVALLAVSLSGVAVATEAGVGLYRLMDDYFEADTQLNPNGAIFRGDYRFDAIWVDTLSDDFLRKHRALNEQYLTKLGTLKRGLMDAEEQNSYDLFLWDRKLGKQAEKFPFELLPLNQFYSTPNFFAKLGSGISAQPFKTVQDYDDFLKRIDGFTQWMKSAKTRMQQGMAKGITQPRALMEKVIPQLSAMVVDDVRKSIFWSPIRNMPKSFSDADRVRLKAAYAKKIKNVLVPSYRTLRDFVRDQYVPKARTTSGMSALPNGKKWYQWYVRYHTTTTDLSAEQIHNIGIDEVKRIHREMGDVMKEVKFKGNLTQFFKYLQTDPKFYFKNDAQVMARYENERIRVEKVLPKFFDIMPKTKFIIRPVEKFRAESSAGASYEAGTPDGSRPGVFYINTFNLKAQPKFGVETLFLHEAEPGHHFQISIAQELTNLPKYQRFADYNAYTEGWALYSESIGKEMGLFTDPYQYYGRLSDELLRAMRLVMDTGLHAQGWTREQAIKYMEENSSMAHSDVVAEVERYMAIPGQALAYKIGQLKISGLRHWAEESLGKKFDIRTFHDQVLTSGALPMNVLESKIRRWVAATKP